VRQTSASFLGLISSALRANYDKVAEEPLPERWLDLINYLNEREKVELDSRSARTAIALVYLIAPGVRWINQDFDSLLVIAQRLEPSL